MEEELENVRGERPKGQKKETKKAQRKRFEKKKKSNPTHKGNPKKQSLEIFFLTYSSS